MYTTHHSLVMFMSWVKRSRASAQRTRVYIVLCCGSVTAAAIVQRQHNVVVFSTHGCTCGSATGSQIASCTELGCTVLE